MIVKKFPGPRLVVASVAQGRAILRGFCFLVCRWKGVSLGWLALALALAALVWPHDQSLLGQLHFWRGAQEDVAWHIAWFFSTWGDYPTYNLPLALALWLYGAWRKDRAWRRVAMICFLGASLAGLFDDCFRLTLGRPRPDTLMHTHFHDQFYGIAYAFSGGFQSFPSGHAASVFGTAVALLLTELPLGLLTTAYALAVVWARMEIYRHYPSDVIVGSAIAFYFGGMVGFGARLRRSRSSISVPPKTPVLPR